MSKVDIPYGRQDIQPEDIEAVIAVLRSDWLTQGSVGPAFERGLVEYCGAKRAVVVNSATSALHIACLALDLGKGDWLWTSPNTFLSSAYAGLYCGAQVDFVDIDLRTGNMDVTALAEKLDRAERDGRLPKVVVPVHFAGQSCDMRSIRHLADRYGFHIVEDAAHAIGGRYRGLPIGSGEYSDITVFSFHPVKVITTAEGGAAMTNNEELANRMERLRSHGSTRDPKLMHGTIDGPWVYQAIELGWNYRMTEMQAALGLSQMGRLDEYVARRGLLAERYDLLLANTGLTLPGHDSECVSAWHLYTIGWNEEAFGISRREAFDRLRADGIGVQVHYIPVHSQPVFQAMGFRQGQFPNAEAHYARTLTIPLYGAMSEKQQDIVVAALDGLTGRNSSR